MRVKDKVKQMRQDALSLAPLLTDASDRDELLIIAELLDSLADSLSYDSAEVPDAH